MDDARVISEELGIERTGEVVLFSPSSFEVEYRGSLEGAQAAIDEILAGEAVSVAMTETTGAMVSYEQMASVPSYSQDIAPILAENCASCHREGGIAPFAMDSHTMVKGWSPMIREVLMTKRMPPGQIDGHIGEFINDMLIEDQEVRNIIAWVEAGAPKDDANDPLAELTWPETKWAFGEPDYIIKVPPQSVPATGVVDYRDVAVLIDIPEDRWLRGSQYIAGDRTVLHHTINRLDFPGETRGGFLGSGNPDKASITAYIPGATPQLNQALCSILICTTPQPAARPLTRVKSASGSTPKVRFLKSVCRASARVFSPTRGQLSPLTTQLSNRQRRS
jgi:mono/diheme cytochrome c family protein